MEALPGASPFEALTVAARVAYRSPAGGAPGEAGASVANGMMEFPTVSADKAAALGNLLLAQFLYKWRLDCGHDFGGAERTGPAAKAHITPGGAVYRYLEKEAEAKANSLVETARDTQGALVAALSESLSTFHAEAASALSPPGTRKPPKKTLESLYLKYFARYLQGRYADNLDTVLTIMSFRYGPGVSGDDGSTGEWPGKGLVSRTFVASVLGRKGEKACGRVAGGAIGYQFTDAWGKGGDSPLRCVFNEAADAAATLPAAVTTLANILDPAPSRTTFQTGRQGYGLYEFDIARVLAGAQGEEYVAGAQGQEYARFIIEDILGAGILVWVNAMLTGLPRIAVGKGFRATRHRIRLVTGIDESTGEPSELQDISAAYAQYVAGYEITIRGLAVDVHTRSPQGNLASHTLLLLKDANAVPAISESVAAVNKWRTSLSGTQAPASVLSILRLLRGCGFDTPLRTEGITPKGNSDEVARVNAALMSYKAMGDWIQWYYATALLNVKAEGSYAAYSRTVTRTNDKYVAADFMQTAGEACAAVASVSLPTYMEGIKAESSGAQAEEEGDTGVANLSLIGPNLHVPLTSPKSWWPRLSPFVQYGLAEGDWADVAAAVDVGETLSDRGAADTLRDVLGAVGGAVGGALGAGVNIRLVLRVGDPPQMLVPVSDAWAGWQESYLTAISQLQSGGVACQAAELLNFPNSTLAKTIDGFIALVETFKSSLWDVFRGIAQAVSESTDHVKSATRLRIASARCFDATGTVAELSDAIRTAIETFKAYQKLVRDLTWTQGVPDVVQRLHTLMADSERRLDDAAAEVEKQVENLNEILRARAKASPDIAAVLAAAQLFEDDTAGDGDGAPSPPDPPREALIEALRSDMQIANWEASFNYRSRETRRGAAVDDASMFSGVWRGWQAIRESSLAFGIGGGVGGDSVSDGGDSGMNGGADVQRGGMMDTGLDYEPPAPGEGPGDEWNDDPDDGWGQKRPRLAEAEGPSQASWGDSLYSQNSANSPWGDSPPASPPASPSHSHSFVVTGRSLYQGTPPHTRSGTAQAMVGDLERLEPDMVGELQQLEHDMALGVSNNYAALEDLANTPTSGVVLDALVRRIGLMVEFGGRLYGVLQRLVPRSGVKRSRPEEDLGRSDSTIAGGSARRVTLRRRRSARSRAPGRTTLRRRRAARARAAGRTTLRRRRRKALRRRPTKRSGARRMATDMKARLGAKPRTRKKRGVPRRTARRKPR